MKKVAAIHDLSSYGRASLTVVIPILSNMGYQVCPLPTAILSAHSEYKNFRSFDLTDHMEAIISHWKELGLSFDALYSGYLASLKQMDIVAGFFDDFKTSRNFILVDPVLGDHNRLYPGMDPQMIEGMRRLCGKAGIITPNLTEAAFLLGKKRLPEYYFKRSRWLVPPAQRKRTGICDYHFGSFRKPEKHNDNCIQPKRQPVLAGDSGLYPGFLSRYGRRVRQCHYRLPAERRQPPRSH